MLVAVASTDIAYHAYIALHEYRVQRENGVATSIYGNMMPFSRHFHVVFGVMSSLLNPSNILVQPTVLDRNDKNDSLITNFQNVGRIDQIP